MKNPPCHIANLITKHRKGTCSPAELEELHHWLQSEQSQQELESFLNDRVNSGDDQGDEEREKQALRAIYSRLQVQIGQSGRPKGNFGQAVFHLVWRRMPAQVGRVAAGVALVFGLTAVVYHFLQNAALSTQVAAQTWVSKASKPGQKLSITLPDGSRVKLNSQSAIRYPADFNRDSVRYVQLQGEAFFEVISSNTPFVVDVNDVKTRVLGTAFNIKEKSDNKLEIALLHGKVQVETDSETLLLLPSEMAVVQPHQPIKKTHYQEKEILGWKDGVLYLKAENFEEIIEQLEAWYGVDIEVKGTLPHKGIEAHYQNETLARVLKGLGYIANFDYKITQNKVIINPNLN